MPEIWKSGVVYNVFLWHVATHGHRPIIDQHAWRGYCYVTRRPEKCEFPVERTLAVELYHEYETWFQLAFQEIQTAVNGDCERRDLDKSLMAFGQFCKNNSSLIAHYNNLYSARPRTIQNGNDSSLASDPI